MQRSGPCNSSLVTFSTVQDKTYRKSIRKTSNNERPSERKNTLMVNFLAKERTGTHAIVVLQKFRRHSCILHSKTDGKLPKKGDLRVGFDLSSVSLSVIQHVLHLSRVLTSRLRNSIPAPSPCLALFGLCSFKLV